MHRLIKCHMFEVLGKIIILICTRIIILLQTNVGNYNCYCEYKDGKEESNGIMCGMGQNFLKANNCSVNEWCTGPSNANDSVPWDYNLCSKCKMYSTRHVCLWHTLIICIYIHITMQ